MDFSKVKREKMVASGRFFEKKVASLLTMSIDCRVIANPKFYSPALHRGMECDLLVLTPNKVYCIECKNYNGFINGSMFDPSWTFVSSGKLGHVQNPYLLNLKHIRLMRGTFYKRNLKPIKIDSFIVVPDKCKIHVEDCGVVHLSELLERITYDFSYNRSIYNLDMLEKYFNSVKEVVK